MIRTYRDCIEKMWLFCRNEGFEHRDFLTLGDIVTIPKIDKEISIAQIKKVISAYYGLVPGEISLRNRRKPIRFPRQLAHYYALLLTEESQASIGKKIGKVTHPAVINSRKKINQLIDTKSPSGDYDQYLDLELLFAPYKIKKAKPDEDLLTPRM